MANDSDSDESTDNPLLAIQELEVYDIMIPRADIIALDLTEPLDNIIQRIHQYPYNRYPVYQDTSDEILGYISVKKVFKLLLGSIAPGKLGQTKTLKPIASSVTKAVKPQSLDNLVEKALFTVRSRLVLDLLEEMRREKVYMALIIDEYGGIDGLVTQKNLMDAVLACLQKESHNGDYTIQEFDDKRLAMDARLPVEQLESHLGEELFTDKDNRDDVDTVGGLVFLTLGRIPKRGEVIQYNDQWEFSITDADARRIKRIMMQPLNYK